MSALPHVTAHVLYYLTYYEKPPREKLFCRQNEQNICLLPAKGSRLCQKAAVCPTTQQSSQVKGLRMTVWLIPVPLMISLRGPTSEGWEW